MEIKGPKTSSPLGSLRDYARDPWAFVNKCHREYGHRVKLRMLHQRAYLLSHPEDILGVLQENADSFAKGRTFKKLKLLLGEGLITSEGDLWKKQNRLMRPVFGIKHMMNLVPSIQDIIQNHCTWEDGQKINVHQEMNTLTLKIIARTLFALDLSLEAPTFLKDVEYMMHFLIKRVRSVISAPMWLPLPSHQEFYAARDRFDNLIKRLLVERRSGHQCSNDLLQILVDTRDEDGNQMSDRQIRDEIITILMAGHETITNTMAWSMILLAQNPHYLDVLREESKSFWLNGQLNEANFNKLNMHLAVTEEAMRLWPPVWAFMRQASKTIQVNGLELKKRDIVFLMPFFAQRSADFWQDPMNFYPERFLPPLKEKIQPGSYFPFGLGPRMCIGKIFAQVEAKLILSHLSSHFQWSIDKEVEQTVEAGITLRPTSNIMVIVRKHLDGN